MRSLRRRLEAVEQQAEQFEMSPNSIRTAMRRWTEAQELPEQPALRAYIVDLYATIDQMEASVPECADEPIAPRA